MMDVVQTIIETAKRHGVDPRLAVEVAVQESGLRQSKVGAAGEVGIYQLLPSTAAELGVDPYDPIENIEGGIRYLRQQLLRFGDPAKALAAYNAGPSRVASAVEKHGENWMREIPSSTVSYVNAILGRVQTEYLASATPASVGTELLRRASEQKPEMTGRLALALAAGLALFFVGNALQE